MTDAEVWQCTSEDYFADREYITRSMIMDFRRSRSYFYERHIAGTIPSPEPTPAMQVGTWGHIAVLEPERWERDVVYMPKFDRRTKAGKAAAVDFEQSHEGKIFVPERDYEAVCRMRDAVYHNRTIRRILDRCTDREHCVRWTDPTTGLGLKAKRDARKPGRVLDLKFVHDAAPYPFVRGVVNHAWYVQAALYTDSEIAITGENDAEFYYIAVHKEPPYECAIYGLGAVTGSDDDGIDMGRREYRRALQDIAQCMQSGDWRNEWEKKAQLLELPSWAGNESEWR